MRIETALRRYLLQQQPVTSLVQQRVWKYRVGGGDLEPQQIDQTGRAGIVIRTGVGWADPSRVGSAQFPRVFVDCISDCSRDSDGLMLRDDANDRAYALAAAVHPFLVYPELRGVEIGAAGDREGVLVVSSVCYVEARSITVSDYHTVAEVKAAGDTVTVRTEYAMEVLSG